MIANDKCNMHISKYIIKMKLKQKYSQPNVAASLTWNENSYIIILQHEKTIK